jgi:hypothetical protein
MRTLSCDQQFQNAVNGIGVEAALTVRSGILAVCQEISAFHSGRRGLDRRVLNVTGCLIDLPE